MDGSPNREEEGNMLKREDVGVDKGRIGRGFVKEGIKEVSTDRVQGRRRAWIKVYKGVSGERYLKGGGVEEGI